MDLSRRGFFAAGAAAAVAPALATAADAPQAGQLSTETLGTLLSAMGLKPEKVDQRYDFTFRSVVDKEEWGLSMSAVMSADKSSLWIMAWLDELPTSAADVPRTALLRLLAANDRLGNGKFFAYVATNRRFVLQRVIANENISTRRVAEALKDLGVSVVETHAYWETANWSSGSNSSEVASDAPSLQGAGKSPSRTAAADGATKTQ
ncbi:hypothetical protein GC176_15680 [bacterium]|nr:hypothetical protein [bacterium]